MVDRAARTAMVTIVECFLDGRLSFEEFDKRTALLAIETGDETIKKCQQLYLAMFYEVDLDRDDLRKETGVYRKEEWDFLHRVLLLLRSEGELISESQKRRSWEQCAPVMLVVLASVLYVGFSLPFEYLIPITAVVGGVGFWRCSCQANDTRKQAMVPFSSISEILHARRRVPFFEKKTYGAPPNSEKPTSMWGKLFWGFVFIPMMMWIVFVMFWALAILSPLALWMWARPRKIEGYRVVFIDDINIA